MPGTANSGGRNAKSTQTHVLQGTFRADRHGAGHAPEPPPDPPTPPRPLSGEAHAEWDRMVHRLETSRTLSVVDDAVLYQYVQLWAETEQITTDTARVRKMLGTLKRAAGRLEGRDLVDAISEIVKLQFLIAKHTLALRQGHLALRQYLVEFGMTPTSRSRVKVPATKTPSKLEQFLAGKAHA